MPLQPRVTGENIDDQWTEEVTYELNNIIDNVAAIAAADVAGVGQDVIPVYAVDAEGTNQSFNLGSRQFVYFATVDAGTQPSLPLPAGTIFTQFRGEQTRRVELTIHTIPTAWVNATGETQDYTNFLELASDWALGRVEPEEFEVDADGLNFDYRTDTKMLMARVIEEGGPADPTLARSFDYTWSKNGFSFDPMTDGVTVDFPFIFIQAGDITSPSMENGNIVITEGRASQFYCNIVQL